MQKPLCRFMSKTVCTHKNRNMHMHSFRQNYKAVHMHVLFYLVSTPTVSHKWMQETPLITRLHNNTSACLLDLSIKKRQIRSEILLIVSARFTNNARAAVTMHSCGYFLAPMLLIHHMRL